MKVLMISTVPFGINGITNVIMNLYKNIDIQRVHIDFVVPETQDINYVRDVISSGSKVTVIIRDIKHPFRYIAKLIKIAKTYDIIHVHGNSATMILETIAAILAGVKIRFVHVHSTTCEHKILNKLVKPFFLFSYTRALACSSEAGRWLYGKRSFSIINNGFNVESFKFDIQLRNSLRKGWNINEKMTVIGHVGAFNKYKNQKFLVDVFHRYNIINPNSKLILIGDGILRKEVESRVENLNLQNKVVFLGEQKDVSRILNAFDCFIFPSIKEGLGIVGLEAQANGLTVISSENVPESMKINENYYSLSLMKDPITWAEFINDIKKERINIGADNVMNAGFNIINVVSHVVKLYESSYLESNKGEKKWM